MIAIFYRKNGKLLVSQSETELSKMNRDDVLWIDILSPSGEEKHTVDDFLGEEIQSRAQAEEIESSSRFSETEDAIFANTNFLMPGPEDYSMEAVSYYPNGYTVFASIMEQRVDLDADMIELMSKEVSQYSKRINQQEDIDEDFLLDINQLQENTMLVRENIVDKQRLISNMLRSDKYPKELHRRFSVLLQDINSLINHTNFGFERLEYLQDTVVGLINLDQNKIMKIFTLVSVLLMPPTLVASFYGMNVPLPLMDKGGMWLLLLGIMVLTVALVIYLFKKNKLL